MKWVILSLIRIYWLIPDNWRKRCLFKESCSQYVFRITRDDGFVAGLDVLRHRFRQCRPGYGFVTLPDGQEMVVLADGSLVEAESLAE